MSSCIAASKAGEYASLESLGQKRPGDYSVVPDPCAPHPDDRYYYEAEEPTDDSWLSKLQAWTGMSWVEMSLAALVIVMLVVLFVRMMTHKS